MDIQGRLKEYYEERNIIRQKSENKTSGLGKMITSKHIKQIKKYCGIEIKFIYQQSKDTIYESISYPMNFEISFNQSINLSQFIKYLDQKKYLSRIRIDSQGQKRMVHSKEYPLS